MRIMKKELIFTCILLLCHFLLWYFIVPDGKHFSLNYDSFWYSNIVENGYSGGLIVSNNGGRLLNTAFYPLYPSLIWLLTYFINPFHFNPDVIGSIVSTFLYFFSVIVMFHVLPKLHYLKNYLFTDDKYTKILIIFSCCSYIFYTNHTESLFLFLFVWTLYFAYKKNILSASILAGLCALTKNQGVLFAIIIALILSSQESSKFKKIKTIILSGFISGILFFLFPLYLFYKINQPFAFILAQNSWPHINSIQEYFLDFKNHFLFVFYLHKFDFYEQLTLIYRLEVIYYFFLLFVSIYCLIFKKFKLIFLFFLLCLLLIPMQHSFQNTFRFTVYFFPVLCIFGSFFSEKEKKFIILAIGFSVFCFLINTINYANFIWSY